MIYSAYPDTAVFKVNGHTVSSTIKWRHGEGFLTLTGEKISEVMRRVDSAAFFLRGARVEDPCSFAEAL